MKILLDVISFQYQILKILSHWSVLLSPAHSTYLPPTQMPMQAQITIVNAVTTAYPVTTHLKTPNVWPTLIIPNLCNIKTSKISQNNQDSGITLPYYKTNLNTMGPTKVLSYLIENEAQELFIYLAS